MLELATLKFIYAKEDALLIGPPGIGKRHVAQVLALATRLQALQHRLSGDLSSAK